MVKHTHVTIGLLTTFIKHYVKHWSHVASSPKPNNKRTASDQLSHKVTCACGVYAFKFHEEYIP